MWVRLRFCMKNLHALRFELTIGLIQVRHTKRDCRTSPFGIAQRRRGTVHLRRALFLPALVAAQHEPHVTTFYQKLLGRGKTKMQANVAVMRKLLHAIYGMMKHDRGFDGEKFYVVGA